MPKFEDEPSQEMLLDQEKQEYDNLKATQELIKKLQNESLNEP